VIKSFLLTATLALAPLLAFATQPYVNIEQRLSPEQLHATGLDKLSTEELAALNEVLQEDTEATAKAAAAKPAPPLMEGDPGRGNWNMGLDEKPIKTKVIGTVAGWEPGTEFKLANGQTWKVLKGSLKLRKPMENPEVELVPGMMGRWFFHIDEDLPGARIYRID
jgi:hypothetical protein